MDYQNRETLRKANMFYFISSDLHLILKASGSLTVFHRHLPFQVAYSLASPGNSSANLPPKAAVDLSNWLFHSSVWPLQHKRSHWVFLAPGPGGTHLYIHYIPIAFGPHGEIFSENPERWWCLARCSVVGHWRPKRPFRTGLVQFVGEKFHLNDPTSKRALQPQCPPKHHDFEENEVFQLNHPSYSSQEKHHRNFAKKLANSLALEKLPVLLLLVTPLSEGELAGQSVKVPSWHSQ